MEIADVIAHAIHFHLLLCLSRQQVEELGAILVVVQADLAVMEGWSHLLLRFRV